MIDKVGNRAVEYSAFISHASADRSTAQAICEQLEGSGFRCWIAPRDVRPGAIYLEEIIGGIESSKCLILVLSQESNKSPFVRNEVERAYSKGKPLFPFRIEDVLPSPGLELLVSTAHWIDAFRGSLNPSVAKLASQLAADTDILDSLPLSLKRSIIWRRRLRVGGLFLAAAVLAAGIAGLVAYIVRGRGPEKQYYSRPPNIFFSGVSLRSGIDASVLLQDGYDQDGSFSIFKTPLGFELFDADRAQPTSFFRSVPGQFKGYVQSPPTFSVELPRLPLRAISCIAYSTRGSTERQAVLDAFRFTPPERETSSVQINEIGNKKAYSLNANATCASLAKTYADAELEPNPTPAKEPTMADRAKAFAWRGTCARNRDNSALVVCYLNIDLKKTRATSLWARFDRVEQLFHRKFDRSHIDTADGNQISRYVSVALPNLGPKVEIALVFEDGSRSDPVQVPVRQGDVRPWVVSVPKETKGSPGLYVAYDTHYLPQWSVALPTAASTQAFWSSDGVAYSPTATIEEVANFVVTPSQLGLDREMPPAVGKTSRLWIKLNDGSSADQVFTYDIDWWALARDGLRSIQSPDAIVSCQSVRRDASGVECRFNRTGQVAPAFLFSAITWGKGADALADVEPPAKDANPSHRLSQDWHRCGVIPTAAICYPFLILPSSPTTLFFRFVYWDGKATSIVPVAVQ